MTGTILKALSGFYYVEHDGALVACRAPGIFRRRGIAPLVGDRAEFEVLADGAGILREILPRKNFFRRPAVANVDQVVLLAARVNPVTDPFLLDRVIALAESKGVESVVCINKCDLDPGDDLYAVYRSAGFSTLHVSAETGEGRQELLRLLAGRVSVFTGNSGVGKSSVLNMLDPNLAIATGEVSEKLGRGRHTTRHVELFRLPNGGAVMDTPGFASFDMEKDEFIPPEKLADCFREFTPYRENCRFTGCSHRTERGCAVLAALREGRISPSRHRSYVSLYEQASAIPAWERDGKA